MTNLDISSHHYVILRIDQQSYALPLRVVSRAVRMVALTPVPEPAPWVAGIINVAGRVTPVVDLHRRLGGCEKTPDPAGRLLILDVPGRHLALMVDEVLEVLEAYPAPLDASVETLIQPNAQVLTGVIRHAGILILVLDPGRLC